MSFTMTSPAVLAACMAAALIAGCGGGGGDEPTASGHTNPAPAPAIQTSASQGNLGFYGGTWRSVCGFVTTSGVVRSVINTYHFPASNVPSTAVALEQLQFSDSSCEVRWPKGSNFSVDATVSVKYIRTYTLPVPTGTPAKYAGQADTVEITTIGANGTAKVETKYMAIDAENVLHISTASDLSGLDLTYSKQQFSR